MIVKFFELSKNVKELLVSSTSELEEAYIHEILGDKEQALKLFMRAYIKESYRSPLSPSRFALYKKKVEEMGGKLPNEVGWKL